MLPRRIVAIAAFTLIAACGEKSPTGVNAGASGTITFNFTGGGGGAFNATGAIVSTASASTALASSWALGWKESSDGSSFFEGNQAGSGGLANTAVITIDRQTPGSSTIDVSCNANVCTDVFFFIGRNESFSSYSFLCVLQTGTVAIASISNTNATGTFSGSGICTTPAFATSAFAVTNGSFNVPLFSSDPGF